MVVQPLLPVKFRRQEYTPFLNLVLSSEIWSSGTLTVKKFTIHSGLTLSEISTYCPIKLRPSAVS